MTKETNRVGVIGIGAMGMPIALNLCRQGFRVSVRDIRVDAEEQARAAGLQVADSPRVLTEMVDVIIIVVVDAGQIDDVLFGPDGVACPAASGKTILLCSTIAPEDTCSFARRLRAFNVATVDAPISGGPVRAANGTISMMIAGEPDLLQRHEVLLAAMSDKRFLISPTVGDGAKAKLVNNLLAGVNLVAGAEALALGMKVGLQPEKLFGLICASSGASWIFQDRMERALRDDFEPRAFTTILNKDMTLATKLADGANYDTPLGDAALEVFRRTIALGWGNLDDAAVIKTYLSAPPD